MSLLSWERGLKLIQNEYDADEVESLLSWERGLKFGVSFYQGKLILSLLSWERGLKYGKSVEKLFVYVAPLVGAWIEI